MIYELNDTELDVVAAGAPLFVGGSRQRRRERHRYTFERSGTSEQLRGVLNDSIKDIAKNNNVGVGAIIQALGGVAAIRGAQTA